MVQAKLVPSFLNIPDDELASLARIADQLFASRPLLTQGHRPHRLLSGQGLEFLDHREYSEGDDLRNIDWRVTARSHKPQIRRHRDELTSEWYICLDGSASMFWNRKEKWQLACQLGIAFSYMLLHLGNRVGLMLYSDRIDKIVPAAMGRAQFAHIARNLAGATAKSTSHQSHLDGIATSLKPRTPVVIISDFLLNDDLQGSMKKLITQDRQIHCIQVNSNAETSMTARGPYYLKDVETNNTRLVNLSDAYVEHSSRQLQQHIEQLHHFCRKHGIIHTSCRTEKNWKDIILQHLKGLTPSHV